ncbi:MAG: tetratricopeptide repeat protein [Acidobacteria bacterium]|nr:tetratricopeptide repeat protein [Acidobacteriota bacterium]
MKKEAVENDTQLRRYLLDELPEDVQQLIEERLLVDNDYLEQLLIVEEDLIEDYTANRLPPHQQAKYQKLFLASPEGRQKLQISQVLKTHLNHFPSEIAPQPSLWKRVQNTLTQILSMPVLKIATAAVLVLGLGLVSWWAFFQSDLKTGINALKGAYGEERPLEARITSLAYARFSGSTKASSQTSATKLKVAHKAFEELTKEEPTTSSLHALGNYHLTQKQFDDAIKYLVQAAQAAPDDSSIHTDLGVAYLEKGKLQPAGSQAQKADFEDCLNHFRMAITKNPTSPEASFNLALFYQTTQAWGNAVESWNRFLGLEPNTKWAEEARRYLNIALQEQKK